jgi:hypothetical protein
LAWDGLVIFIYLVLHPKHKLKYFKKQGWDKKWINTAEEIVREEFKRNYAEYVVHKVQKASRPSKKVSPIFFNYKLLLKHRPFQRKVDSDDSTGEESAIEVD